MVKLSEIKRLIEQIKPELIQRYHVRSIGLFGSVVREDFSPSSDIDIIVDFTRPIGIEFVDLANLMEERLQRRVDLVSRKGIKDTYYQSIKQEIVPV